MGVFTPFAPRPDDFDAARDEERIAQDLDKLFRVKGPVSRYRALGLDEVEVLYLAAGQAVMQMEISSLNGDIAGFGKWHETVTRLLRASILRACDMAESRTAPPIPERNP